MSNQSVNQESNISIQNVKSSGFWKNLLLNQLSKIETGRANWHWMEVTAFMVFMLFAPETLRETLMSEQDAIALVEETALLEQRLASLEQRISDIEKQ